MTVEDDQDLRCTKCGIAFLPFYGGITFWISQQRVCQQCWDYFMGTPHGDTKSPKTDAHV